MPLYIVVYTKGPKYSESTHTHAHTFLQLLASLMALPCVVYSIC